MKGILKIMLFSLMVGVVMTGANLALAASEETQPVETKEVVGTVESVDMEQSLLIVTQLVNAEEGIYENVTISVTEATTIEKNYEAATLSIVMTGDKVSVQYTINEEGKMVASHILVESAE